MNEPNKDNPFAQETPAESSAFSDAATFNPVPPESLSVEDETEERITEDEHDKSMDAEARITERAKTFKPGCKQCFKLVSATGAKMVKRQAKKAGLVKQEVKELSEASEMTTDSIDIGADSLSRILARRVKSSEGADIAALAGVMLDWGVGLNSVLSDIKEMRQKTINIDKDTL